MEVVEVDHVVPPGFLELRVVFLQNEVLSKELLDYLFSSLVDDVVAVPVVAVFVGDLAVFRETVETDALDVESTLVLRSTRC